MSAARLHDMDDPLEYVTALVGRLERTTIGIPLTDEQRDDLIEEGLVKVVELAKSYKSRLPGYEKDGSFVGYAKA
jgi:hypothetical protein